MQWIDYVDGKPYLFLESTGPGPKGTLVFRVQIEPTALSLAPPDPVQRLSIGQRLLAAFRG